MINDFLDSVIADESLKDLIRLLIIFGGMAAVGEFVKWMADYRLDKFESDLKRRASLCRTETGYAGALIAKYTVMVTFHIFIAGMAVNFANFTNKESEVSTLTIALYLSASVSAFAALIKIISVYCMCWLLVREVERADLEIKNDTNSSPE